MKELADGTLPQRMETVFARHFPGFDPSLSTRQISRRCRKSMVRRLLELVFHRSRM
jgi:hypothetical protein